jgi:hypothetical protein
MGSHKDELLKVKLEAVLVVVFSTWAGITSLTGVDLVLAATGFACFSAGALVSFDPHCSQKLFDAGFLALQLGQIFVSAIRNSLGISA